MWIDMKVVHLQAINLKTWMFCELYVADSPSEYVYTLKQEKKKRKIVTIWMVLYLLES